MTAHCPTCGAPVRTDQITRYQLTVYRYEPVPLADDPEVVKRAIRAMVRVWSAPASWEDLATAALRAAQGMEEEEQ